MNSKTKIHTKRKISIVFATAKSVADARLSKVSRQVGRFEIAKHFAAGRSVVVLEGRQIVKLSKDGTRVVICEI